jgi:hypothetical protein
MYPDPEHWNDSKLINMLLNPESISFLYEVALQDLALSPQDDKGMTDKILRDETGQPNTQAWNTEIYLRTGTAVLKIRDMLVRIRMRIRETKKIWIPRIRMRIRNTGRYIYIILQR